MKKTDKQAQDTTKRHKLRSFEQKQARFAEIRTGVFCSFCHISQGRTLACARARENFFQKRKIICHPREICATMWADTAHADTAKEQGATLWQIFPISKKIRSFSHALARNGIRRSTPPTESPITATPMPRSKRCSAITVTSQHWACTRTPSFWIAAGRVSTATITP